MTPDREMPNLSITELVLAAIRSQLASPEFTARHRTKITYFTRKAKLSMEHMVLFMLNMVKSCQQIELDDFFKILNENQYSIREVTDSAFTQARQKFSHTAFIELNRRLVDTFYQYASPKLWHGFRLLAIDGSIVTLPKSDKKKRLLDYFGTTCEHSKCPNLRLSQLYDVYNNITLDVNASIMGVGERTLAREHLQNSAKKEDLVLYDRGYPAFWLFAYHMEQGIDFCARVSVTFNKLTIGFVASGEKEANLLYIPASSHKKEAKARGISTEPFMVRFVRIELPDGEVEVLITSVLDSQTYPYGLFKDLYHQRWSIEEDYKTAKSKMELENFTGLTVGAIQQDIHAKILSKNIVATSIYEAQPMVEALYGHRKLEYQINESATLSKFKDCMVMILLSAQKAAEFCAVMLKEIAINAGAVRKGRQNKRDKNLLKRKKGGHSMAYKRTK
ncbi:MAG: hypothetical protein ACI8WB_000983 [Phenylobacterium sp.]|jgi:hypothetical protein